MWGKKRKRQSCREEGRDTGWGGVTKKERGVYSKKPISSNAKPSSDAPQTKQTKHLIRLIVRDIPQLNVCAPMRARCVVNWSSHNSEHESSEIFQQNVAQVSNKQILLSIQKLPVLLHNYYRLYYNNILWLTNVHIIYA